MRQIAFILILSILALACTGCPNSPKSRSTSVANPDSVKPAAPLAPGVTKSDSTAVYFAMVFPNGNLVPFAKWDSPDGWDNPWPTSVYEEDTITTPQPVTILPRKWFFYALDDTTVRECEIDSLTMQEIHCYRNWAVTSNLLSRYPGIAEAQHWRLGFASTERFSIISDSLAVQSWPDIEMPRIREQLKMLPSGEPGYEGFYHYSVLGYFRIRGRLMGVGVAFPWEAEKYQVFEITWRNGRLLIETFGGGC